MKEDAEELSKLAKRFQDVLENAQVDLGAGASANAGAVSAIKVGGVQVAGSPHPKDVAGHKGWAGGWGREGGGGEAGSSI